MIKWIAFLFLLGTSVAIFVFAPLGLVGHFVTQFTPPGLEWVGTAFAIGLSLSVVANAFLARWRSMRAPRVWLVILAVAESAMSGGTLYGSAVDSGRLDLVFGLGILAVVVMQEAVLISGGMGMSQVLDKIGEERHRQEQRAERHGQRQSRQTTTGATPVAPDGVTGEHVATATIPAVTTMSRPERLDAIRRANATRNGSGPMTPAEVVTQFHVSLRQAQRDVAMVAATAQAETTA